MASEKTEEPDLPVVPVRRSGIVLTPSHGRKKRPSPSRPDFLVCRVPHFSMLDTIRLFLLSLLLVAATASRAFAQGGRASGSADPRRVADCSVTITADDDRVCIGDSTHLHASGDGTFAWTPDDGTFCANCADIVIHPLATTTYRVTRTAPDGCVSIDSVLIIVNPHPWAYAGADMTICVGDSVPLSAYGGVTFEWTPTEGLTCTDCSSLWAKPLKTTTYILKTANVHGCVAFDTVVVTVVDEPVARIDPVGPVCPGGSAQLHASGGNQYSWSPAAGLSCTDCADPIASPSQTTTYTVVVSAGTSARCTASANVTVAVVNDFSLPPQPPVSICPGAGTTLSIPGGVTYHWEPATGLSCTDCPNPVASPSETTTYTATVTNSGGCTAQTSLTVQVGDDFTLPPVPPVKVCPHESAHLSVPGGVTYRWSPATGLSCTDCPDPIASPDVTTTYSVTVTNAGGCTAQTQVTVIVDSTGVVVPAHIARDYRVRPGSTIRVPVVLDAPLDPSDVSRLQFHIAPVAAPFEIRGIALGGTLLDGWHIDSTGDASGMTLTLTASAGQYLKGTGSLLDLLVAGYLGSADSTSITFDVTLPGRRCPSIVAVPGLARLDSLCGLSLRLIEMTGAKYALGDARPNPVSGTTAIAFSLGLDGPTSMIVRDGQGTIVARLVEADLGPGGYVVNWSTAGVPSGIYYCTLTSGAWNGSLRLLVVK
jgi:uncharacterized repeat protein (TIGR01451 family)